MTRRQLVVCCDGTNNTLTGGVADTNVLKLHGYLRKHADPATTLLYYDPGVGTPDAAPPTGVVDLLKRRWERFAGLASGRGVYENIGQGYAFLMREWREGDRIFCFGFSRGAFTARAIVGMVNLFGILRPEHETMIPTLVRIYFSQPDEQDQAEGRAGLQHKMARLLHLGLAKPHKASAEPMPGPQELIGTSGRSRMAAQVKRNFARVADVYWVGVWDTVESVGLPPFGSRDNPATATFHDKPHILNVRHALSLDEHRWPFLPRLYDAPAVDAQGGKRTLKQLWFPGVHCDVGGSYPVRDDDSPAYPRGRTGLADGALVWMVNEVHAELGVPKLGPLAPGADDFGMPAEDPFPGALPLRHDALHDTPFWALAGMTVRTMTTRQVRTNREVAAGRPGVTVDVQEAPGAPANGPSVWDERRSIGWLAFAALAAVVAVAFSGWNLMPGVSLLDGWAVPMQLLHGPAQAKDFAIDQFLSIVPGQGLHGQALSAAAVGWAMAWDLVLIAALGYLLARAASRVFTWAAGTRHAGQQRPAWLLAMGWLPALAIGADLAEDALTVCAIAFGHAGLPFFAALALWFVGVSSLLKLAGWLLCIVVFGGGRLLLAVLPTQAIGKVGRRRKPAPMATATNEPA